MLIHPDDIVLSEKAMLREESIKSYDLYYKGGRESKVSLANLPLNGTQEACNPGGLREGKRWAVEDKPLTVRLYLLNAEPCENVSNSKIK